MTNRFDEDTLAAMRADARRVEAESESTDPYPDGTTINQPNRRSRMFNVRLTEQQYNELQRLAEQRHLPMATMARSWLLARLDQERRAS